MRRRVLRIMMGIVLGLLLLGGILAAEEKAQAESSDNVGLAAPTSTSRTLKSHDPIDIRDNSEFNSTNGVTSGSGTKEDPYIIDNWYIDAGGKGKDGISISNTDAYFIIRNCRIYKAKRYDKGGIRFYKVTNGKIDNVTLYQNDNGISLKKSSNNKIKNCKVYNNSWWGIYVYWHSSNNKITNCTVYNNSWDGISLVSSSNNKITNCRGYNNEEYGIELGDSSNNKITNCKVYNNEEYGIELRDSSNNKITNCTVYNNWYGIVMHYKSSNNKIHYSNMYNNKGYGVSTDSEVVNATNNWWGSRNGPGGEGPGGGDKVSKYVLYEPWLNEEVEVVEKAPPPYKAPLPYWALYLGIVAFIIILAVSFVIVKKRKKLKE